MSMSQSSGAIVLPPGVSVSPGRETVQQGPTGQAIQGMTFTLTLTNGAQTSVFVPYNIMSNTQLVAEMFAQRVAAINTVAGLGG